ncbi:MAG TPA: DUF2252 domain-containing protein [Acidobacteriaceae bacterium]|nr:DUF2252 domain-containing protein [Acidobacteriaceae bacterium]
MAIKHVLPPPDRRAFGQSRRKQVRRQEQNRWRIEDRQTDPIDALAASSAGRVPALLEIKWQRMAASPFGFFRGAVSVMAADLAVLPHTGIFAQLCGDAHVRNLGAFAAPDGRLVFDINDFDETIRGPFEWDVKRLATSIILAGREAGSKSADCGEAAALFLKSYRRSMHAFARMTVMEVAHFQVHRLQRIAPVSQVLRKAEQATPLYNAERLLQDPPKGSGLKHRIFVENKPLQYRITGAKAQAILDSLGPYRQSLLPERRHFFDLYRPIDVAFRVVGTGSVGLRDYIVYLEGNSAEDPLFLQIKEETFSAYAPYLGEIGEPQHQGQRVVQGQRAMQFLSDMLLGWTSINNRQYLVRQLNDHKGSLAIEDLKGEGLMQYAEICGELLARGHARSGDPVAFDGYIGTSDRLVEAVAGFAIDYADQTEQDYKTFLRSRFAPKTAKKGPPAKASGRRPKLKPGPAIKEAAPVAAAREKK